MQDLLSWFDEPLFVIRLVGYMVDQSEGTLDTYKAEKTRGIESFGFLKTLNVRTNEDPLPTAAKERLLQQAEVEEGGFRAWATVLGASVIFSFAQYRP
jgi:hypothetical protein